MLLLSPRGSGGTFFLNFELEVRNWRVWFCNTLQFLTSNSKFKKISRNLTLEIFNSGERRRGNIDIPPPSSSRFSAVADQGGPPGVATGPLSHYDGAAVATQQGPRGKAVRPLRQNFSADFIAHFLDFRRNTLWLRRQKMHAQNSRICGQMILISEFFKDLKAFVLLILSF